MQRVVPLKGGGMEIIEVGYGAAVSMNARGATVFTIGRDASNDVVVASDSTVSRSHARMEKNGAVWKIFDLDSSNGTFVNGIRVRRAAVVRPGDRVSVGKTTLTLSYAAGPGETSLATLRPDTHGGEIQLSPRETEVLRLVAEGRTDQEVAETLSLSVRTVHSHLDRVRDKLQIRRRSELTRYAIGLGLLPGGETTAMLNRPGSED